MERQNGKSKTIFFNISLKYNVELPSLNQLKEISKKLDTIRNYQITNQELTEIISRKKEQKIKNRDKNMNITYELGTLHEEYNATKQKYSETKSIEYLNKLNELKPKLEILNKMALDKETIELNKAEYDRTAVINKKNIEKQREHDKLHYLLNKKKNREKDALNPYKRKDCKPINLFDNGYLNKNVSTLEEEIKKQKIIIENQGKKFANEQETNEIQEFRENRTAKLKRHLINFVTIGDKFAEVIKQKKEKEIFKGENNYNNEDKLLFSILGINKDNLRQITENNNKKLKVGSNTEVITVDQIEI